MELITSRLCLRPFRTSDFEAVHRYASNPENVRYMVWGPNDEEASREFLSKAAGNWDKVPMDSYDFAIVLKDTGILIGGCGIYMNDSGNEGMLGWILHMDYWKHGYMSEAAKELIRFGFERLSLHRIYATCNADNYGSYRVMEKCGMKKEAHFRKNRYGRVFDQDQWFDEYYYAILKEEWEKYLRFPKFCMEFKEIMEQLHILQPPESWERNFDALDVTAEPFALPTKEKLQYYQTVYHFPDLQLEQMTHCSEFIEQNNFLKQLWQLWYTVLFITKDCNEEQYSNWPVPDLVENIYPGIFRCLVIIAHTDSMFEIFKRRSLPENYLEDGIQNFTSCTQEGFTSQGFYGLSNDKMWWLWPFMLGHLFLLGRLQYEVAKFPEGINVYKDSEGKTIPLCTDNEQRYDDEGFESMTGIYHPHFSEDAYSIIGYGYDPEGHFSPRRALLDKNEWQLALQAGDDVLSLHIPGEDKLTIESVLDSFKIAKPFFEEYFPEKRFKALVCHTWLFNTQLKAFLPLESNILAFQQLFTIMLSNDDIDCLFDFIFNTSACPLDHLKPKNAFQSKVLGYVLHGGKLRDGFGYRLL